MLDELGDTCSTRPEGEELCEPSTIGSEGEELVVELEDISKT